MTFTETMTLAVQIIMVTLVASAAAYGVIWFIDWLVDKE